MAENSNTKATWNAAQRAQSDNVRAQKTDLTSRTMFPVLSQWPFMSPSDCLLSVFGASGSAGLAGISASGVAIGSSLEGPADDEILDDKDKNQWSD
jgi:hypothetical protein